jgi:hypothetical protein
MLDAARCWHNSSPVARATDDRTVAMLPVATDYLSEGDHDSFSETMTASESLTTSGSISGGSDSYTSDQNVNNAFVVRYQGGGGAVGTTVPGAYRLYYIVDADQVIQSFHDVGSDSLGPSDTILAGTDSYTWVKDRYDSNNITDYGKSDASVTYSISAWETDSLVYNDVGWSSVSGTFTTASDCYTYGENSGDGAISSESDVEGSGDTMSLGGVGSDGYNDTDIGTIYSAGTSTYSNDVFTLDNYNAVVSTDAHGHSVATDTFCATFDAVRARSQRIGPPQFTRKSPARRINQQTTLLIAVLPAITKVAAPPESFIVGFGT